VVAKSKWKFRVNCQAEVADDSLNLQFLSTGCPGSIPKMGLEAGPLANNGGPTLTEAVVEDSPAIGAIPNGECTDQEGNPITTDQRLFTRPATPGGPCTIGAFEFAAKPAPGGIGGIPPDALP